MARNSELKVTISGDTDQLNRALKGADRSLSKFGKQTSVTARVTQRGFSTIGVAARGAAAGLTGIAAGAAFVVKEFEESAKVGRQTAAVIKSTGGAAKVTAKDVDALATALSNKTGMDDEAIASAQNLLLTFTKVRNETGKGNDIFNQATTVVADMSAALGQDLKASSIQVGKALNDPVKGITALSRVGVSFTQQQKDQVKAMVESGRTLDAQKFILRELNTEFAGSAAAAATPFDRLKVATGNLAETLGGALAPTAEKVATAMAGFISQMQSGEGAGGRFVEVLRRVGEAFRVAFAAIASAVQTVRGTLTQFFNRNREELGALGRAAQRMGEFFRTVFTEVLAPVARRAAAVLIPVMQNLARVVTNTVQLIAAVINGDWRKAWGSFKGIVSGIGGAVVGIIRGIGSAAWDAVTGLGKLIVRGIVKGLTGIGGKVKDAILGPITGALGAVGGAVGKLNPFGDGIGAGGGGILTGLKNFSGSLMGANARLAPFAAVGAKFGLRVSSGRRPGAVTKSGNRSLHADGNAIDLAGSPSGMMQAFQALKRQFGSRLAELIYTPGGVGIKNGVPHRYTGQVAADHFDHVHVGFTGAGIGAGQRRRTGQGDGPGFRSAEFESTSYGPPWDAMNGTGITKTGVNLKGGPKMYGIAVDPRVIPLGATVKVSPNPFGHKGYFRAFDTGGAIKGKRIDFYDWRGRKSQYKWGRRKVRVSFGEGLPPKGRDVPGAKRGSGGGGRKLGRIQAGGGEPVALDDPNRIEKLEYAQQVAQGNTSPTADFAGGDVGDVGEQSDPNQPLIDAIAAAAEQARENAERVAQAQQQLRDETAQLRAEVKRNTEWAQSLTATQNGSLTRSIADLISGQIAGAGIAGRALTAGAGSMART